MRYRYKIGIVSKNTRNLSNHMATGTIWPLGQLRLLVTIGDAEHSTKAWMNFMIARSLSPYNGIIGRPEIKEIQAVPSTAHGMLKFPVDGGIVTIRSIILIPAECATEVAIGGTLSAKGRTELCSLLKENLDIFAWQPSDMTGVPRSVAEHRLNIREGYSPVRQKKRGQAPKRAKAIQAEVQKLVEAGIMREVYYHDWLSNPVMVKKHDGSWRMCVDFTDLNKACPQDCYPLPEIDWKVESLCGYPYKCFLDAYKGYHQIQMAESDEEKTAFHTSHGVYCYTKMPFGLKNAGATYQRLVDKAFDNQVGQNIEVSTNAEIIAQDSGSINSPTRAAQTAKGGSGPRKRPKEPSKRSTARTQAEKIRLRQSRTTQRIVREVYYHDWLSNPVMVKKHDDSWRMCVDFTDLNKACPQDCYPLLEIDWKVESLYGYPFKYFLDAYKGNHQIQMAESDEEKTAFHTSHGVYCYTKMPFGLKNAGATYQWLVDKAFDN
ncbi:reverse transcriptase domain-containing protein [Tanacetum coccineum]